MTEEALFRIAQIQAGLWTFIDAACVGLVVAILDELRVWAGGGRSRFRWGLIALSLLVYPFVFVAETRMSFFQMEAIVVSLQFAALLHGFLDLPILFRLEKSLEDSQ